MSPANDKALCEAFPNLYRDRRTDMRQTAMCWGFPGDGWFKLLWRLSEKLEPLGVVASQVKEKYGTLRFYTQGVYENVADQVDAAIHEAEAESAITCEVCGAPGTLNSEGWLSTLCEPCRAKPWRDFPFRYFMQWVLPRWWRLLKMRCFDIPRYGIDNRLHRRYAVFPTTLNKYWWHEPDAKILHAAFQCLVEHVEAEGGFDAIAQNMDCTRKELAKGLCLCKNCPATVDENMADKRHKKRGPHGPNDGCVPECPAVWSLRTELDTATEVFELYWWWTTGGWRPPEPPEAGSKGYADFWKSEAKHDREVDKQLARLIKIRRALWT